MIVLEQVEKVFRPDRGEPVTALQGIDLSIADGSFVTVVGPSGCGKSTLLKLIAGLDRPTSGTLTMDGTPITGPRRDIGIVFQAALLLPWRTILGNAMLAAELLGLPKGPAERRARELLETVGLAGFEQRYPFELSGGMQQRASITRALLADPSLLLMDEPFGALDALTREQMAAEIEQLWLAAGKTVFFITHSIPEAVFLGDRVVVMTPRPGRIEEVIEVGLPRPRGLDLMGSPEFGAIATHVRHLLNLQGVGA